ncbi:hypothetical protein ACFX1R_045855 [Malus domestica]
MCVCPNGVVLVSRSVSGSSVVPLPVLGIHGRRVIKARGEEREMGFVGLRWFSVSGTQKQKQLRSRAVEEKESVANLREGGGSGGGRTYLYR